MLRTNLSTRPFYNERAVHAIAAAVALVVLALTAWQVVRVLRLSRYRTELSADIKRNKSEADYRTREAAQIRRGLDQADLAAVATAAREANDLIEQRTFSWTALFNDLESTLPDDVMLTAVHPEFKDVETQVNLDLQGRRSDDIDAFWDRLDKSGSFRDIQWSNLNVSEEGLHKIQMKAAYEPAHASGRPAAVSPVPVVPAPAPASPPPDGRGRAAAPGGRGATR